MTRRLVLFGAVIAGIGLVASLPILLAQGSRSPVATERLTLPLQPARVVALGRIEPVSERVKITGPTTQEGGRLAEIVVNEGDWVEAAQVLAVLETRPRLAAALMQAEATLALRQAQLRKLIADLDNQEKMLAAALEQQEAQRERSKWDLDRLKRLQQSGVYQETALIDKRLALEGSTQALESARLQLVRNRSRDASGNRIDEASARAEIDVADASVQQARAALEFAVIRAPVAGRILRRFARSGEQVGQDGLLEMGDTRVMMVRAEVFESDIARLSPGQSATITSRALAEPLIGVIDRIGLTVNRQSIVGEDPAAALDARVIEVMVRLDPASSQRVTGLTGLQVRAAFGPQPGA
ncbi:MAG: HlyD family efflux transporter periplasmic adaptor subunit [Beijerinckiaceae bacterium]|nr:HlyD family efflux transporter periplasmic adaptor subunit [Beijerinckiaceae bacterium]MCZ8301802.1 HlyD family efflux transporter periplasmic adaptor subunit [Beijerinckiaceae bacterium]